MNETIIRTITGSLFVATLVLGTTWYPILGASLFTMFGIIGVREMESMFKTKGDTSSVALLVMMFLLLAASILLYLNSKYLNLIVAIPFVSVIPVVFDKTENKATNISLIFLAFVYVVVPSLILITMVTDDVFMDGYYLLFLLVVIWTNDTMAYVTGKLFGKHKIVPKISPKKSWEGTIGGVFFASIAAFIMWFVVHEEWRVEFALIGAVVGLTAFVGDLVESSLKRHFGVKDSGKILPGHGGVLDRMDATYFSVSLYFVLLQFMI